MFRRQQDQEIEFSGFCLNEPFKGKTIQGTINLAVADSLELTKGANFNNRPSELTYNYREEGRNSRYREQEWSNSKRRREESTGNQVLTVLFSLIFFITFVANHLIDFSHESSATLVLPDSQSQVEN